MKKIKKTESLRQQVYTILKEEILNKDNTGEELLYERKISDELNVSRTPVREALKALELEGLVEYVPYKGIVVKRMSQPDLKNIFQIRKSLEELAIELAMQEVSAAYIRKLEGAIIAQEALLEPGGSKNKSKFIDLDSKFHGLILEMAGNELLTEMMLEIRDKIRRFGLNAIFSGDYRYKESVNEHRNILEAMKKEDVAKAKEAVSFHMIKTYENAYKYLTEVEPN